MHGHDPGRQFGQYHHAVLGKQRRFLGAEVGYDPVDQGTDRSRWAQHSIPAAGYANDSGHDHRVKGRNIIGSRQIGYSDALCFDPWFCA